MRFPSILTFSNLMKTTTSLGVAETLSNFFYLPSSVLITVFSFFSVPADSSRRLIGGKQNFSVTTLYKAT